MEQNRRDFLKWSSLFGGLTLSPISLSANSTIDQQMGWM